MWYTFVEWSISGSNTSFPSLVTTTPIGAGLFPARLLMAWPTMKDEICRSGNSNPISLTFTHFKKKERLSSDETLKPSEWNPLPIFSILLKVTFLPVFSEISFERLCKFIPDIELLWLWYDFSSKNAKPHEVYGFM